MQLGIKVKGTSYDTPGCRHPEDGHAKKKREKDTIKVWFHIAVYSLLKVKHILWRMAPKILGTLNTL